MNLITLHENAASACGMQQAFHSDMDHANIFYSVEETEADSHSLRKSISNMPTATVVPLITFHNSYRKPCNCAKSHCLKLYCECFARGAICDGCNCTNCMNNVTHDDARRKAIKLTLERNPLAFHPKIGENDRKHSKGCNCKRSGCLKNYCECYEAKINCSDLCRCQGCRNIDNVCSQESASQLGTLPITKPKSSHAHKRPSAYHRCTEQFVRLPHATQAFGHYDNESEAMIAYHNYPGVTIIPNGFLSVEVTEAACSCMLAQLDEAKQRSFSPVSQERVILEEFGKCLEQILESAAKDKSAATFCHGRSGTPRKILVLWFSELHGIGKLNKLTPAFVFDPSAQTRTLVPLLCRCYS
ncbi:unnamed protein product [Dicrocoelium dendriticum]|nr:unnamed protein product [Dicrocoelium dendriticum]